MSEFVFTIATTPDEFRQIDELNHETFAVEIPQHSARPNRRLRDAFHEENTYIVCKDGESVVGMLALRARRPFSLDRKVPDLDNLLPEHTSPCELRLLAVTQRRRRGRVAAGMVALAAKTLLRWGHDLVVVSGTTRQLSFYRSMGFQDFGPLVGTEEARYQPMHLTYDAFTSVLRPRLEKLFPNHFDEPINFLPGPPTLSASVRRAIAGPQLHHRSPAARDLLRTTQAMLCELTGARHVQITSGSGTSANDQVAFALAHIPGQGLVVSNGEFGERLADQATRAGLDFEHLRLTWGHDLDFSAMDQAARRLTNGRWLWCVHGETSTGVLNRLEDLASFCRDRELSLCVDAVSTLGVVPTNLGDCLMATGGSAKGLGAIPGLALLFHDALPGSEGGHPRSMDPHHFIASQGVPHTVSSMLLAALRAALQELDVEARAAEIKQVSAIVRAGLRDLGLAVVAEGNALFEAVISLQLPEGVDATRLGVTLEQMGFLVAFRSSYLKERNWVQICFMSPRIRSQAPRLLDAVSNALRGQPLTGAANVATVTGRPAAGATSN